MKKIYISGKITGLSEKEYQEKFEKWENHFLDKGYDVINPVKVTTETYKQLLSDNADKDTIWNTLMRECLKKLMDCDSIFMMNDSIDSIGAQCEHDLAKKLDFECLYEWRMN